MKIALISLVLLLAGTLQGLANLEVYMRIVGETEYFEADSTPDELIKDGFFPLKSVSIGVENNINIGSISAGGGAGKATFKELKITKAPGKVSTDIFQKLVSGRHYDDVEIIMVRSDGRKGGLPRVMSFQLKLVMAQSLDYGVSDGDDDPEETLILQFGAIKLSYYTQDKGGKESLHSEESWSRVKNNATLSV